jgi:drug/metabolite transporter (DMT)-like permease
MLELDICFSFLKLGSSVLAHFVLKERLEKLGVLGCVSCIVGSVVVVMHAPEEHMPNSVEEIWNLATQPGR